MEKIKPKGGGASFSAEKIIPLECYEFSFSQTSAEQSILIAFIWISTKKNLTKLVTEISKKFR